ncbi:unnamed protein product [Protopolystoma xenopodis]|uniref:G-protein coupled receptors family 1 profile domain-containing protein n=1 Tax=Protopolystoma xenopodis TaxID=117903 RepID=A0A3S5A8I7_9PLAT|nr:unnamed protein product [Protopolystoma xenopodis]
MGTSDEVGLKQLFVVVYNATTSSSSALALAVFRATSALIIIIGAIFGNGLVIVAVMRFNQLRRVRTNAFLVSLAFADLLVAIFAMPFNALLLLSDGYWPFGQIVCNLYNANDVFLSTASIVHLCCVSTDRYLAITRPFKYKDQMTRARIAVMLVSSWMASFLISYIPIWCGFYTTDENIRAQQVNAYQCLFVVNPYYAVVSSTVSFWLPCLVMSAVYTRIYFEARRQESKINRLQPISRRNCINRESDFSITGSVEPDIRSDPLQIIYQECINEKVETGMNNNGEKPSYVLPDSTFLLQNKKGNFEGKNDFESCAPCAKDNKYCKYNATWRKKHSHSEARRKLTCNQSLSGQVRNCFFLPMHNIGRRRLIEMRTRYLLPNNQGADSSNHKQMGATRAETSKYIEKIAKTRSTEFISNESKQESTFNSINTLGNGPREHKRIQRENKAAKTLGMIMGAFILCWLPFFLWYTASNLCGGQTTCRTPGIVVSILFWIGYFNSTLNPIIYVFCNREFRNAFICLLGCRKKRMFSSPVSGISQWNKTDALSNPFHTVLSQDNHTSF